MPAHDGLRFYDDQNIRPSRPQLAQCGPEETIKARQCGARPLAFEHSDLLPQREDFKRCMQATAEEHTHGSEECGDEVEHELRCNTLTPAGGDMTTPVANC